MNAQRFQGLLYILAGVLTWHFVRSALTWVVARRFFPIPDAIFNMGDVFYHVVGLVFGLGVILLLFLRTQSKVFMEEVAVETMKVTWPTMKDTVNATIVVSIAILIAGFAFWVMDFLIGMFFSHTFERLFK